MSGPQQIIPVEIRCYPVETFIGASDLNMRLRYLSNYFVITGKEPKK
jgi:hypothetical protein